MDYRENAKNIKPRGLYFSNALFEGLIIGAVYTWRGLCGGKFALLNRLGLCPKGNLHPKIDCGTKVMSVRFY